MNVIEPIIRVQDLLDSWRNLGSLQLEDGVELIGRQDGGSWLHVVFPGMSPQELHETEVELGTRLPARLRALYKRLGGMTLFGGAFQLHGLRRPVHDRVARLQPQDLIQLDRVVSAAGWKPEGAVAFAENSWDLSVHVAGMGNTSEEIVRCERMTGQIVERHNDILGCLSARLTSLDAIFYHTATDDAD